MASGWYRQCFAGLEARLELGAVSVAGESGSRLRTEHGQRLRFLGQRGGSAFTAMEMQLRGSAEHRLHRGRGTLMCWLGH